MNWIKSRLSEASSYASIGIAVMALGTILNIGEAVFIGLGCAALGLIISEEKKEAKKKK